MLRNSRGKAISRRNRCLPWFKSLGPHKGFHQDTPIHPAGEGKESIEHNKETSNFMPIYHGVMPGTATALLRRMSEAIRAELVATRSIHDSREEFWDAYAQWIRNMAVGWSDNLDRKWAHFHQHLETGKPKIVAARKEYQQAFGSLQNLRLASRVMNKSVSRVFQTRECQQMLSSMREDKKAMKDLTGCDIG